MTPTLTPTLVTFPTQVNFNVIGVLFMAAASCSDALRLVVAQKLLKNLKLGPIETQYFTAPICILWMIPAAMLTELPQAIRSNSFALITVHPLAFAASGVSGCLVNLTSFLLVRRTSSMTLKTMTMARNGGLVLFSALLMGESISNLEALGYTGLLGCFAMYTYVKSTEAAKPTAVAPARNLEPADSTGGAESSPTESPLLTNSDNGSEDGDHVGIVHAKASSGPSKKGTPA